MPKVSVIMPTYNGEKYIGRSIESVLSQTMGDFELIIIDDGSTDKTIEVIKKYKDPRIRFFQNEKNEGISITSNRAIGLSVAPYIAPLDQDDISAPKRLELGLNFMEKRPDFGVIGGWISLIDEYGKSLHITHKSSLSPEMIPASLLFVNYFDNGTTMIRKEALPVGDVYREMSPAQDYDLWLRIDRKWKMWNMPHVLLQYRIHANNTSTTRRIERKEVVRIMLREALGRLGMEPTDEEMEIHCTNDMYYGNDFPLFFDMRESWLKKVKKRNEQVKYYEPNIFAQVVAERWLNSCGKNTATGLWVWRRFWQSELNKELNKIKNFSAIIRLLVGCCLKRNHLGRPIHKKIALIYLPYLFASTQFLYKYDSVYLSIIFVIMR